MLSAVRAAPGLRWPGAVWVWARNGAVWLRSWKTSMVGCVGEPLFYFLGLGYGLASLIPSVQGQPYLHFVAPGLMLASAMQSTTIEATYGTFTKLAHQQVFDSMLLSPLEGGDIVLGELLWAVTKGALSGGTVLLLTIAFGVTGPMSVFPSFALLLVGSFIFACLGMTFTSVASGYDSFNYYFTLIISPMFFFSGIFFPVEALGPGVKWVVWVFPLTHLVRMSRAIAETGALGVPWQEIAWVGVFSVTAYGLARWRMVKRMQR